MEAVTERLQIRDLAITDLEAMIALWMDAGVKQGMGTWGPQTEEDVLPWIEDAIKQNQVEPRFAHNSAIVERSSGVPVGWIGFGPPSVGKEEWGDLDFGYAMRPEFSRLGYASEALSAVIEFCFTKLGVNSFFGETMPGNLASARVMEKVGMKVIGTRDDGHVVYRIEKENRANSSDPVVYPLALELIEPSHWVAYILGLPGCFSSGKTEEVAVGESRERIREYFEWLASHGGDVVVPDLIEIKVDERYAPPDRQLRETSSGDVYIVNAFFRHDSRPLTKEDLQESTKVLSYQREDLLALLASQVTPEVEKLLLHVGSAEWWYWDRMDLAFPREDLPDEWRARLSVTRSFTLDHLPSLLEISDTKEKMGEVWSARKLLRRVIWHERDHTSEIALQP